MIVRDERPLSLVGDKFADYKQHLRWMEIHQPKGRVWLLVAAWVLVAALGLVAVLLGLSTSDTKLRVQPPPQAH